MNPSPATASHETSSQGAPGHVVRVVAITGGKGGVGKTNVAINLGIALARQQQRVLLLDADLGLANIDVLLGLKPQANLEHVLAGECELRDIMLEGPGGIRVIPASSGTQSMVRLGPQQHAGLIHAFSDMSDEIDILLVDTAAGISDSVVSFVCAAQEVLVVVCDEPSSITDAYALIKLLNQHHGVDSFRIVANQTRNAKEGKALYQRLVATTDRFLDVMLRYEGDVPFDDAVRKAVRKQQALLEAQPGCPAAKAFEKLGEQLLTWPMPGASRGQLEFFIEQLVEQPR